MRNIGALALLGLVACSEAPAESATAQDTNPPTSPSTSPAILVTALGRYEVNIGEKLDLNSLPSNSDLKMVDGDITAYARQLCRLDVPSADQSNRCDVYVQPDPNGLLVGYATISEGQKVRIETSFETDGKRGGLGCFISGELLNSAFDNAEAKIDISRNFEARIGYVAWEKSRGDWMVSFDNENIDTEGAGGMWYVKHSSNKLRISQERWSYCYKPSDIYIDEVFVRAVSFTRLED